MKSSSLSVFFLLLVACSSTSSSTNDAGSGSDASTSDVATAQDSGSPEAEAGPSCTSTLDQLLGPIDMISTGDVSILSNDNGVLTIYVDASAGGPMGAMTNPRTYITLTDGKKAMVTDKTAKTSTAWDLAIKRPILFTNSGHGGIGQGAAVLLDGKDFASVTSADANGKTFETESFVDGDCNPKMDATGAVLTSFDGWYDYNMMTNQLSPHPGTWLVKGASGKLFKIAILGYYSTPDGGMGMSGGRYVLKVAAL